MACNSRVLVLGAYGTFGARLCEGLQRIAGLTRIWMAGRDLDKASAACVRLADPRFVPLTLDLQSASFAKSLAELAPDILIHCCGPFQGQDYQVARAALMAGAHYLDLADGRAFVCGISVLNESAQAAGKLLLSGVSTVPALSFAALDALKRELPDLSQVSIGVTPGNRSPRGVATVAGVLSYVGQPLQIWQNHRWCEAWGWQSLRRHVYPAPVGARWLSLCDVPDLSLLPEHYPQLERAEFRAGLELSLLHLGLSFAAWLSRLGFISNWARHAVRMKGMSEWLGRLGSDSGAMHVEVAGTDAAGRPHKRRWTLLAQAGDGPQIPATAAVVMVRKLCEGSLRQSGAGPCVGYFSIEEFMAELAGYAITVRVQELS